MDNFDRGRELTAVEAALQLGLSRERVIRLIQRQKLPGRRDPEAGWLVDRQAVEMATTRAAV